MFRSWILLLLDVQDVTRVSCTDSNPICEGKWSVSTWSSCNLSKRVS